jgi:hypothetical protein
MDGAEHSAKLESVMADPPILDQQRVTHLV